MGINYGNIIGGLLQGGATTMDQTHSGNGSNLRTLRRMEIVYKNIDIPFAVNPSDYTQKEPNRVNITQTKGGAWIDAWGPGIVEINIKGITGVAGKKATATKDTKLTKVINTLYDAALMFTGDSGVDVGYQRWRELRDMFRQVYQDILDGQTVTNLIKFYNWTDNEYWYCYPTANGLELYRSKSKPHVYQYTLNLWGIRRIGEPEYSMGVIGNPYSAEATTNAPEGSSVDNSTTDADNAEGGNTAEGNDNTTDEAPGESSDDQKDSTNTSVDPQSTIQGGIAYVTSAAALDTKADVTTVTNTRTKNNATIRTQSEQYANALAPIIGGYQGVLVPTTAYFTARDLVIDQSGIVLHVADFDKNNFLRNPQLLEDNEDLDPNRLLEEMRFAPLVSVETYSLWNSIRNYSSEVLTPDLIHPIGSTVEERIKQTIENSKYYGSTLYGFISQYKPKYYLTKTDIKYIEIIILDSMAVYTHLWKVAQSSGKITMPITATNITTLIKNIQALIIYLEFNATDDTLFYIQNIMWELRQLEATMHQVKSDIIDYL